MYQNFIIPYLYEAQHVLEDTLPITRSLKLHWQPLVFHTWKDVGRVVGGTQFHPDPARKLSANLYNIHRCCVYSEKRLMMDRETVRNM